MGSIIPYYWIIIIPKKMGSIIPYYLDYYNPQYDG